jgi:hypothetical protein
LYSIFINGSYCFTEWVGLGFFFIKGDVSWRLLLGCQLIPASAMFACSFLMPESPRFLIYSGRVDEALSVLEKMHGDHEDETFYLREFHQIRAQIELEKGQRIGFKTILTRPPLRKRFLLVFGYAISCM